ncbi:MAG: acyltransferase [Moraxellaceae bacterium]|jgi:1-acyl-sn-glycerol-3-phosphate acyltransferase|nr:acyltransferase [Moraxellaceae bacterium]
MSRRLPDPLDFSPPPRALLRTLLGPRRFWFAPQFFGLEHLDAARPALYVGNHTIYGVIDSPLMVQGVYEHTGIFLRSLGDHFHFVTPVWGRMLLRFGAVDGTPENCARLMESGAHIMVYPGGAREVMKNAGEEYRLVWKRRTGFARMAMEHGYDIIPFAAIGADDALDIRYDSKTFQRSWAGRLARRTGLLDRVFRGGDTVMPLATGVAGSPLPRPEKMYFMFGERIPTRHLQAAAHNRHAQWQVRHEVEKAIYRQMDELFAIRARDHDWSWWRQRLIRRKGQT